MADLMEARRQQLLPQRELVNTHDANDVRIQTYKDIRPAFDGMSTTQNEFKAYPLEPRGGAAKGRAGNLTLDYAQKFTGQSSNTEFYPAHQVAIPHLAKGPRSQGPPSDAVFYDTTTSREAFVPHAAAPRQMMAPPRVPAPKTPFYGSTTTQDAFKGFSAEGDGAMPAMQQPMRRSGNLTVAGGAFEGKSETQERYLAHQGFVPAHAMAPNTTSLEGVLHRGPGGGFADASSTTRQAYIAHKLEARALPATVKYEPSKAYFYGSTTAGEAFRAYPEHVQTVSTRPAQSAAGSGAAFQGQSETRERYQGFDMAAAYGDRAMPVRRSGNLTVGDGARFEGQSAAHEAFRGWQLPTQRQAIGLETVGDRVFVMVPRNERLPAKHAQVFTTVADKQSAVRIKVLQGGSVRASENEVLASFELVGIEPQPCGHPQILVTFSVNEDSRLHIDAIDKLTGKAQHIAVDRALNPAAFG